MKIDGNLWQGETRPLFSTASDGFSMDVGGFGEGSLPLEFCVITHVF